MGVSSRRDGCGGWEVLLLLLLPFLLLIAVVVMRLVNVVLGWLGWWLDTSRPRHHRRCTRKERGRKSIRKQVEIRERDVGEVVKLLTPSAVILCLSLLRLQHPQRYFALDAFTSAFTIRKVGGGFIEFSRTLRKLGAAV